MGAALSQPELLDHPGRSHRSLRDDRTDRTQTILLRAALSELQRSESLPAGPLHLSLSFLDLFWLPAHAPCLLYHSSPQSCTVRAATLRVRHFPPKPLEELHCCSQSVCDHFVRDSAIVLLPLPLTVTVQHRLLPRVNVSRMYAECFDKVLYHINSRILKCKMTNVITRL